jgi:hypothetical protein
VVDRLTLDQLTTDSTTPEITKAVSDAKAACPP